MIMHHHIQQNWSKQLRHLIRKHFRMWLIHQTWLRRITTYLHRWDTHLLSSASYEDVRICMLNDWFGSKEQQFFWRGIHKLSNRWKKCIATDRQYFE